MKNLEIELWSRGKTRDHDGNCYYAYRAIITVHYVSYFQKIIVTMPMSNGSCAKENCLQWAINGIKEALNIEITPKDIIAHHHKKVLQYKDLEKPENWKC